MEKSKYSGKKIFLANLLSVVFLFASSQVLAQGPTSSIGDRENQGLFGGPANDLSISFANQRVFGAVHSPSTLFFSDDNANTWNPAFPFDSLEYDFGNRGWGGGAFRVITNQSSWVAVHTGFSTPGLSASVISYDNGNSFQTAIDPYLMGLLVPNPESVTAMAMSNHYIYSGLRNYLVRQNDTTAFGANLIVLNMDTVSGVQPGSSIVSIAVADDPSGFPVFFVVGDISGFNRFFKYDGVLLMELALPFSDKNVLNIFTHPGQISGDTLFVSSKDIFTNEVFVFRSFFGGLGWFDITPFSGAPSEMSDADYSPDWVPAMPFSNGLRLSFQNGMVSDDFGDNWMPPGPGLQPFGIATHPLNENLVLGSNNIGVAMSVSGVGGFFENTANFGFTGVNINDVSESQGIFYVATDAGLAYTKEYFNQAVTGYDLWLPPNGVFPIINAGDEFGATAVAIDPFDSLHVICGYSNGFNISFAGPDAFTNITPPDWNNNAHYDAYVTDIVFVTSNIVIAVSGLKFKDGKNIPPFPVGNIWRSDDGGVSWQVVSPMAPEYTMGNCLTVIDNAGQPVIYSGTGYEGNGALPEPGALWVSYDLGINWIYLTDGPVFGGNSQSLPIYDIDIAQFNPDDLYLSAGNVFARYNVGNGSFFFADIPYNKGQFTSALIDPLNPDTITVTAGRHVFKYNSMIDDADLKFKGMPGEVFHSSAFGSILAGSGTGLSKIVEATTYNLDLKVFVEGPYNGTDLNTTLNSSGYLPLNQPFNQPPWNYEGTESVAAIPSVDIVDWVLIDLRKTEGDPSSATAETRFDRQAAFLLKDGTIVDDDGVSSPRFSYILDITKGSEKVNGVVYAPSHEGERSATEMSSSKTNSTFAYDFTSGPDQVYGGATAHKELSPGVWGMISGDGNHDFKVDNDDKNEVWLPQLGNMGYYFGDFNRDGVVDDIDKDDYWKPNAGKGSGGD
ncbi:MAG: hypothetical protein DRJ05_08250 [Bacteroidetes bacterium]|nr:MAG: hypothetical protein DRJ05_08250 [Bacteroidota bacterium]